MTVTVSYPWRAIQVYALRAEDEGGSRVELSRLRHQRHKRSLSKGVE